ncbi:MAG TPA: glycosyltransferase family 1 protein [Solirubrobacteraceae bacterium]|nr:glycosyltransferase family 1 protein [Solirubrobacteraceae bacterium]
MRVGFDLTSAGSALEEGSGGGPGYFQALIPRLRDDPRVSHLWIFVPSWYDQVDAWRSDKSTIVSCRVPKARALRVAYEQIGLAARATRIGLDVLVSPANIRPLTYRRCNVLVLHAIQHFLLGDDIGRFRSRYLHFAVPRSLRTADLTIAVTETLKQDAVKLFSLDPDRVVPVHMGPQPWADELIKLSSNGIAPYRLDDGNPYVLCISRLYALKNHARLIEAYGQLCRQREVPHRLLIVGGEGDVKQGELEEVARRAGVSDRVVFLGRVAQSLVPPLYAGASAIAYVSLYETFGHPVLEAFATERPLLTSSSGATAEVAGGAARLADPENVSDIAAGLADVLFDDPLRERLVSLGHDRVREFSWDAHARGTVDVLERAVAARRGRS